MSAILKVIRAIPRGKVAAYGQVAALAGSPRSARQVARVLHALSEKQGLPWHRIINRSGRISLPMDGAGALQARLLRREGVEVDQVGKLDLERFGWEQGLKPRPRRPKRPLRPPRTFPARARPAGGGARRAP